MPSWAYPWSPATEREDSDASVTASIKEAVAHAASLGDVSVTISNASPELVTWATKRWPVSIQIDGNDRPVRVWSAIMNGAWVCIQSRPGESGWAACKEAA